MTRYSLHTRATVDPAGMFMLVSEHEQAVRAKDAALLQCQALLQRVDAEKHIQVENQQIVDLLNLIDDCMDAGDRATHGDKAEEVL